MSQDVLTSDPKFESQFGLSADEHGIWRCEGRLKYADIPQSTKYSILLSMKHHFTYLIVKDCHERVMKNGIKETLSEL